MMPKMVNICDVCSEIFAGGDAPKNNMSIEKTDKYNIPIYSNGEANDGLYGFTNFARVFEPSITISARGTIGYTSVRNTPFVPIVRLITLVPKKDIIDIRYLFYAAQNYKFDGSGTSIPQLTVPALKKYNFPLPEIEEQKQIVGMLDKICDLIDLRKQQLSKLDELVKARFVELFGDPKSNPNSYDVVPFNDCVEYMGDIGSNGANKVVVGHLDMKDEEDYALMVRFLNFTKNDFTDDVKYVSEEAYDFFKKSQIFGGELIICKIGSAGQNYVMPYLNRPVSLGLNQIMVRINNKTIMPYLYQYLNTDYGKQLIDGCINGAVTKSITKTELKKIPVIVPPIECQNEFANFVKQIDKSKLAVQQSLEKLETLKKALLQKYFG